MNLYEITTMIIENEGEQDIKCYEDTKELLLEELKNKSANIIKVFQTFEGNITALEAEITRLTELKKDNQKKKDTLKEYVTKAMVEADIKKVDTPLGILSFRKSQSVIIEDEMKIPRKFVTIKHTELINKKEIGDAIKNGEEVAGAFIQEKQNLQIK